MFTLGYYINQSVSEVEGMEWHFFRALGCRSGGPGSILHGVELH